MKEKLKALLAEYGRIAIVIYFTIFLVVFAGFYVSISGGFEPEGVGASVGTLGATWLATKITQPLRIGATLLLTPLVGGLLRRYRRTPLAVALEDVGPHAEDGSVSDEDEVASNDDDGMADEDEADEAEDSADKAEDSADEAEDSADKDDADENEKAKA